MAQPVAATRFLFRDPSLQSGLTLPLVNPPIERGLLSNSFLAFLRLRASLGVQTRKKQTREANIDNRDARDTCPEVKINNF